MSPVIWRWEEKDFGFRFRSGKGKRAAEHYQARTSETFYLVPATHRKLEQDDFDRLVASAVVPGAPRIVPTPWRNYEREWDWIDSEDGICLNYAGCLDKAEIDRREDEGVQRATELVLGLLERPEQAPITLSTIRQAHVALLGTIYPFAGTWRNVSLHKGHGPTKWPLPPYGIQPLMDVYAREVLARTPFASKNDADVFAFVSEVMNELLAIHPFREGNGRTAFILANLLLMQNEMLPLSIYDRKRDEPRYFAACEAGRLAKNYAPLAALLEEWEDHTLAQWEVQHGS